MKESHNITQAIEEQAELVAGVDKALIELHQRLAIILVENDMDVIQTPKENGGQSTIGSDLLRNNRILENVRTSIQSLIRRLDI